MPPKTIKANPADPSSQVLHYIQTTLRGYAIKCTGWCYDADDLVQETVLRFLSGNYSELGLEHQRMTARKIMRNLVAYERTKSERYKAFDIWEAIDIPLHEHPDSRIDCDNLLLFMAERQSDTVNLFWLFHIGYKVEELMHLFKLTRDEVHTMVRSGKEILKRHLKSTANLTGEKIPPIQRETKKPKEPPHTKHTPTFKERPKKIQPVHQFTIAGRWIKTWESPREAQNHFNPEASQIRAMLGGRKKTAYGFIWNFDTRPVIPKARIPFLRT
jgi:DNA-directed RNA polymerase specialized sigma24 family protein